MEDFTRKFNAAQDTSVQIHHVLTTAYEALKEKGYDPIRISTYSPPQVKNGRPDDILRASFFPAPAAAH